MNILFIYPNINGFHEDDTYSFGLASIVSISKMMGHASKVMIIRTKEMYRHVLTEISTFKAQLVGFSSVSSQFTFVKEMATEIKSKFPRVITICGGVHPTINPECILESESLDALFIGEAENSFIEFLKRLESGMSFKDVDNLAYKENNELIINKLKPLINNLDSIPFPDKETYPFKETLKRCGYAPFLFSRGCPYLCSYCSNHAIAKRYNLQRNYPRYRSAESCIVEIEETMKKFNFGTVYIVDDIFGLNLEWREEFCRKYKQRIKIKFICLLRVDLINEDLVELLKDSGCCRVSIGIESGNEVIRNKIMNRGMSNEQIIRAFNIVHKYGLETNAINIIGTPGESEEMIWDTIKLNRKVKPTSTCVNIFYPYKGTKLGDYCFENKLVKNILFSNFFNERRATVLDYPEYYKNKLAYYRENWEVIIYPFSFRRHLKRFIKRTFIWKYLRILKRKLPLIIKLTQKHNLKT